MPETVWMEEINKLVSNFSDRISEFSHKKGFEFSLEQEDDLWDDIQTMLGKYFGYPDYKNHQ